MTKRMVLVLALMVSSLQPLAAQDRTAALSAVFDVARAARYATFTTVGGDGHPRSRIVDPLIATDNTIWVGTNPLSRKVAEIRRDPRVTLLFFNAAANEYVTVLARARVVTDTIVKAAHWKPEWEPFYKNKQRGADFMLLALRPTRYEISSMRLGMNNDKRTWRPVIVDVK